MLGILTLGLLSMLPTFSGTSDAHAASSFTSHGTIYITNNTQFTTTNGVTGGNGTATNPYIIQGWEIDPSTTSNYAGIDIRYTSVYFVIRNVYVHGLSDGIDFLYVYHGTVENNTIANDSNGVTLRDSYFDTVKYNQVSGVQESIWFDDSGFDFCLNNTVTAGTSEGIILQGYATRNITITGNNVSGGSFWGIVVGGANGTIVSHNQLQSLSLGIDVDSATNTWIFENTFVNDAQWIATHFGGVTHAFHNDFLSVTNRPGVYVDPSSTTFWDNGYPSGGNFWFDYTGVDNCSGPGQNICPYPDNIGDTAYQIDFVNKDNYPLMKPFGPQPSHAPIWPPGSRLVASSIQTSSLVLSWPSALGAVRYQVFQSSILISSTALTTTSFTVTSLSLGASYSFKVEAGDAWGNYTTDGPSLTVRVLAEGAFLGYAAWYVGAPRQGGSTDIVSNFTSLGQDNVRVTGATMTSDLGSYSLLGPILSLTSGENSMSSTTVKIPSAAAVGNHTVTITVSWSYQDPATSVWAGAPPIMITGSIPVYPAEPPTGSPNSGNGPSSPRNVSDPLASLYGMLASMILPAFGVYFLLFITAIALVIRNHNRQKVNTMFQRRCAKCGAPAGPPDMFCGTCGTRLPMMIDWTRPSSN